MRKIGQQAEHIAAAYLTKHGFKIIAHNISYRFGELDIVARDKNTLVFIEVKHRKTPYYGEPYEAVTKAKQKKIILAAKAYLQAFDAHKIPLCRFDVISIVGDLQDPKIEHMSEAFCLENF